jgi:hypothetical protein
MPTTITVPKKTQTSQAPKISTHLLLVSAKQARQKIQETAYARQRPLRRYKVEELRFLIERRELRQGTLISFAELNGDTFCVNGQHTLTALGETTGQPYWLQYETHRCTTMEEVDALYQSYDRGLARSWTDLYKSDSRLASYEIPTTHLAKLGAVTPILARGFEQEFRFSGRPWVPLLKNAYLRFALMQDWTNEMQNFSNGCQGPGSIRKLLLRAAVLSVALVTYRYQPDTAHRFWPLLARDSGLVEGEPAHSLLRYLRETSTRVVDPFSYQRAVASAWNAFVDGRKMNKVQPRASKDPILIAGTPHDGRAHYCYLGTDGTIYHDPRVLTADEEEVA